MNRAQIGTHRKHNQRSAAYPRARLALLTAIVFASTIYSGAGVSVYAQENEAESVKKEERIKEEERAEELREKEHKAEHHKRFHMQHLDLRTTKKLLDEYGIEAVTEKPLQGISEYKLKSNGLRILLVERHESPVVMTTVVYHVGSRNEAVGFTGATHFLEHMMFKGTTAYDPLQKTGIDDLLKKVGGINNATTWYDRTNYFEIVPAAHLELCIKLEADRLRNLLLRQSDRDAEMTVVRNELERGEDSPSDLLETNLFAMAFREHPYHHPTIGWRSDVEGVPTERLRKFYEEFYWPDNATLMVIGDFDSHEALELIAKNYNDIPKAPHHFPDVYTKEPPQEGERRFTVRRGSDLPRMTMGFHIPHCLDKDIYSLDVIENVLGDSSKRSSRLYKRLVDTGLASEVSCYTYSLKDPGLFVVNAQSTVGTDPSKLEAAILDELKKLTQAPITADELSKAKKSISKSMRLAIADPMGLSGALTEAISSANWKWWLDYPDQVEKVTAADVLKVSKEYFNADNRTVGYYYPKKDDAAKGAGKDKEHAADKGSQAADKGANPKEAAAQKLEANAEPSKEADEALTHTDKAKPEAPDAEKPGTATDSAKTVNYAELIPSMKVTRKIDIGQRVKKVKLKNGLTILILPMHGSSTVAISGKLSAGDCFAEGDKSLVPGLVAGLMTQGSTGYNKQALADELENMGTSLEFSSSTFFTGFDTQVVKEDLDKFIELLADTLAHPTFPNEELKLEKKLTLSDLNERMADTGDMSWNSFVRRLYKPTSGFYQKDFKDQITELNTIKRNDLVAFHNKHFNPGNLVLSFVGNVNEKEATELCEKYFASWSGGKRDEVKVSKGDTIDVSSAEKIVNELPDKANADVVIGKTLPVSIKSPDYYATILGNAALGYDSFACRLAPVRDKYGLTYGIYSAIEDPTNMFGPWAIKFSVNPSNLKRAQDIVSSIVTDYLKNGITDAELETEKSHLAGIFSVHLRSPKHIAGRLTFYEMAGVEPTYLDEYADNLAKVSVEDVNKAIRSYFNLDSAITSISGTLKESKQEVR